MTTSKKLTKGMHYDESTLEFVEWSNGEENESYSCWDYFDDGVYLGADSLGIEPLFASALSMAQAYIEDRKSCDVNQIMSQLDALDIEKNQDWENETTEWRFGDGSSIVIDGPGYRAKLNPLVRVSE